MQSHSPIPPFFYLAFPQDFRDTKRSKRDSSTITSHSTTSIFAIF